MKSLPAHRAAIKQFKAEEFYLSRTRRPEREPRYWLGTLCTFGAVVVAVWLTMAAVKGWLDAVLQPVFKMAEML